jgi:CHRD domain
MRSMLSVGLIAAPMVLLGCGDAATAPAAEFSAEFNVVGTPENHRAHLTGDQEVPANASAAQGQATFKVSADGSSIHFRVNIANIENTLMSHIHMAPAGTNGGIVVWLRPAGPPPVLVPGRFDGVYAEGTFTEADLVGALAGEPLSSLIDAMRAGNTYVNVHTNQFPGGEIRGQIGARGN